VKKLDFIFFDAGGGHRSAANALRAVIERQQRSWRVELVNLQEVLDPLDIFRTLTGTRLQDVYNHMLKKGWTLGSPLLTKLMHLLIRACHPAQVRLLEKLWRERTPDLVVSLVPNFNRALGESLRNALPDTPLVTILTDLADYPNHFWIERQPQYFACGSSKAVEQALALGHPPNRLFRASGMILDPRFYDVPTIDRTAERQKLGLDPELPTGVVLFGGQGSSVMLEIARRVDASGLGVQLIMICGRNVTLQEELLAVRLRIPVFVEGFTREVPYYMGVSDFFVGKPGPGSISEALQMALPVIVERNAWTLPQERYNAEWIVEKRVGLVVRNFRHIDSAVARLLEPGTFARFRSNAAALHNRAVFEIPDFLGQILESESPTRVHSRLPA
jgi:Monogalactosyldiacylglycerol (MGDG) synthase/Glycosyltransferase family 28 C-terminal domain